MSPWVIAGLVLSAALLVSTPYVWRRRGALFGLRWLAAGLLPAGLALAGLLTLVGRIGNAVASFVSRFVFSPTVWVGWALLGAAVVVWVVAGLVRDRGGGEAAARPEQVGSGEDGARRSSRAVGRKPDRTVSETDDEFADVEEILRRRGI